ncbi:hypothetical protein MferCBS31731_007798 [Microsporum ferrugineum]
MGERSMMIDTATDGTCEWLFQHATYKTWVASNCGLFWIKGKPGSGKSTLLKYALESVEKAYNAPGNNAIILSFFFYGLGDELQKTPRGLFLSLLHQLFREVPGTLPDLLATFERRYKERGKPPKAWQWHVNELQAFFQSSLPKVLKCRPIWLFVDALDECGKDSAIKLVNMFKSWLQKLPPAGFQFRVCFTCRHYPILDFGGGLEICAEEENRRDISIYVQAQLSTIPGPVRDLIARSASGVFMWAQLVVTRVLDLEREGAVGRAMASWTKADWKKAEEKIGSIPKELGDIYKQLVKGMNEKSTSLKLIQWVCFAERPLSLDELRWAMVVNAKLDSPFKSLEESEDAASFPDDHEMMKRRAKTLSCGLVEVVVQLSPEWISPPWFKPIVQLIHQSVKDFFLEEGLLMLDNGTHLAKNSELAIGLAHYQLSRTCIRYFFMKEVTQSAAITRNELLSEFPLLEYAIDSWHFHTNQSEAHDAPQDDLLDYFGLPLRDFTHNLERLNKIIRPHPIPERGSSLLHIVSLYGMIGPLKAILKREANRDTFDINLRGSRGGTPLLWAVMGGDEAAVKLLLETGKVDVNARSLDGWTPSLYAARCGLKAIVKLLIDTGKVDINNIEDELRQGVIEYALLGRPKPTMESIVPLGVVIGDRPKHK